MKIYSQELERMGDEEFDELPMKEIEKMIGWIDYDQDSDSWLVTMMDESFFECKTQESAILLSNSEEIKALLIQKSR